MWAVPERNKQCIPLCYIVVTSKTFLQNFISVLSVSHPLLYLFGRPCVSECDRSLLHMLVSVPLSMPPLSQVLKSARENAACQKIRDAPQNALGLTPGKGVRVVDVRVCGCIDLGW